LSLSRQPMSSPRERCLATVYWLLAWPSTVDGDGLGGQAHVGTSTLRFFGMSRESAGNKGYVAEAARGEHDRAI
jgi:hypothetical protein